MNQLTSLIDWLVGWLGGYEDIVKLLVMGLDFIEQKLDHLEWKFCKME